MYLMLLLGLAAIGCALAFYRWRWGVLAAIAVGLLQDPLRKMVPGVPGYLALASTPVWIAALGSALASGEVRLNRFLGSFPVAARWIALFGAYLLVPASLSATYGTNSWQITILGAVIYSSAFLALAVGWRYAREEEGRVRLLTIYAIGAAVLLLGGPLERLGWGSGHPAIGTEVMGHLWVTHRTGEAVYMLAGFFRGPDVMGWHAAMLTMVSCIMAVRTRGPLRYFWIALATWGMMNIWLCGRRKMVSMIPIFLGCFMLLIFRFRDVRRIVPALGALMLVLGVGWFAVSGTYRTSAVDTFYLTVLDEWDTQVARHGYGAVRETIRQVGIFGHGLGMGQQGIHHIKAEKPRIWQESGPSKLVMELGVPGALLFVAAGLALLFTAYHVVAADRRAQALYLNAGLLAIMVANIASAFVSAQVYGDPFIALLLTFLFGLQLSGSRFRPKPTERPCPP